jgi:predicted dehydrogenase
MGNMGRFHAQDLLDGKVRDGELVAVAGRTPEKLKEYADKGLQVLGSGEEMIKSGLIDAIVVATPHYQHVSLGMEALDAGLHLMVEKPIAAHKADAERLISKAKEKKDLIFSAMFQLRVEPRYRKIKELLEKGELGELMRVVWIMTDWFRSDAYYQSGGWRATWKGEGGGVLLNQCLHQLDAMQWMVGMPDRVSSQVGIGKWHDIEVEDDVSCHMEFPGRASGLFLTSTGETPGSNRLEIAGTKGRLLLENDKLLFTRNTVASDEWCRTSKIGFKQPDTTLEQIEIPPAEAPHSVLMTNFVQAILHGEELIAPGEEGIGSVELANAMLFSGLVGSPLDLPMDGKAWEGKLNELIAQSTHQKKVVELSGDDFSSSFRR